MDVSPPGFEGRSAAILGGEDASDEAALVYVEHAAGTERCSGALLAPGVVVTAAHCAFAWDGISTEPLPASGFRVGFGSSSDALTFNQVVSVSVPQATSGLTLNERVAAGLDVAVLMLAGASSNSGHYDPDFSFMPTASTSLTLLGFGISSQETGESGSKRSGTNQVVGWSRASGTLELAGSSSACLGDSGGPALTSEGHWVGVISSVSASDHGVPCDGHTFVTTVLNEDVRTWLSALIEQPPRSDEGPHQDDEVADDLPSTPAEPQDDTTPDHDDSASYAPACALTGQRRVVAGWLCLPWLILFCARRRRRR